MKYKIFSLLLLTVFIYANDFAQPGTLDSSFGDKGKVIVPPFQGSSTISGVVIQNNGKILVTGTLASSEGPFFIFVEVLNTDGTLENRFGPNPSGSIDSYSSALAIQKDGKFLIAGSILIRDSKGSLNSNFVLVRYNSDLSLDSSFNSDGIVSTAIGESQDGSSSLAIQTDGKIILAGYSYNIKTSKSDFALVRYKTDGSLDRTFGSQGKVVTPIGNSYDAASSIAIQTDGKIVVAGSSKIGSTYRYALVRYNKNGSIDNTFGSGGKATIDLGNPNGYESPPSVAIQTDGKILIAGSSYNGSISCIALLRYNSEGLLDNSFGKSGKVITHIGDLGSQANAIAIQQDGKIVVAGSAHSDYATARYNMNGSLDNTFSYNGKVTTDILNDDWGSDAAIQADGKIVVAGGSYDQDDGYLINSLARYNGDKNKKPCPLSSSVSQNAYSLLTPSIKDFMVYPNPVKDVLHVRTNGNESFSLLDQPGQILLTTNINGKGSINISGMAAGLYYLKNNSTGAVRKVIISR